jgi:hypothetical protein
MIIFIACKRKNVDNDLSILNDNFMIEQEIRMQLYPKTEEIFSIIVLNRKNKSYS